MKKGFTLIELLVVVLIIGILSAVALPQYQKAVEKAKATQAYVTLRGLQTSFLSYYMANGKYPLKFEDLEVYPSHMTGSVMQFPAADALDTKSDENWSLQILQRDNTSEGSYHSVSMTRISGDYKGASLNLVLYSNVTSEPRIDCIERKSGAAFIFSKKAGDYCERIFNGELIFESSFHRKYKI